MTLRSAVGHEHARFTNAPRSLRELGAVTVEFLACSVYNQVAGRSTCSGGQPFQPPQKEHNLVSDAPLLIVRREARQTVHLGANGRKTLQLVAGACYRIVYH